MNILEKIDSSWFPILYHLKQGKLEELNRKVLPNISYQPRAEDIFNAFSMKVEDIKVVILGQDPYPTPGNAMGYSFMVPRNRTKPKSLQIIEREIKNSEPLNMKSIDGMDITTWPDQGVLLLNTALTVETGKAGSHLKYWDTFTKEVIKLISIQRPCMWLLWGNSAKKHIVDIKGKVLDVKGYDRESIEEIPLNPDWNYVMTASHPVAEAYGSGGFYKCDHFYFVNRMLALQGKKIINW